MLGGEETAAPDRWADRTDTLGGLGLLHHQPRKPHGCSAQNRGAWCQSPQAWGGSSHPSERLPVSVGDATSSRVSKRTVKTRTLT